MPTAPGPALWPDCGTRRAYQRHTATGERTCARCRRQARESHRDYRKRRYLTGPRRIPALGTQRRIMALCAIGWTTGDIGARMSPPTSANAIFRTLRSPNVYRDRAAKIAAIYDELWETPGPSGKTRARAAANGWLPPMAWDDDQLENPDYVPLEQVLRDWDAALAEERRRHRNLRQYRRENRQRAVDTEAAAA